MQQPKLHSVAESWANIVVGFSIGYMANWYFLSQPWEPATAALGLTTLLTFTAFARSYGIRRFFNWFLHRNQNAL